MILFINILSIFIISTYEVISLILYILFVIASIRSKKYMQILYGFTVLIGLNLLVLTLLRQYF